MSYFCYFIRFFVLILLLTDSVTPKNNMMQTPVIYTDVKEEEIDITEVVKWTSMLLANGWLYQPSYRTFTDEKDPC